MMVTFNPRDSKSAPMEADAIPFPREETTPPVTKTNLDTQTPDHKLEMKRTGRLLANKFFGNPRGHLKYSKPVTLHFKDTKVSNNHVNHANARKRQAALFHNFIVHAAV